MTTIPDVDRVLYHRSIQESFANLSAKQTHELEKVGIHITELGQMPSISSVYEYMPKSNLKMDATSPQQRLDDAFKDVGKALRDQIEKESQAKQYLESLGWVVMRRTPS